MLINSTTAVRRADGQTGPPGDEERGLSGPRVRPSVPVDLNRVTAGVTPHLTVIVPTRNEEQNVARLLERLGPAVEPLGAEPDPPGLGPGQGMRFTRLGHRARM